MKRLLARAAGWCRAHPVWAPLMTGTVARITAATLGLGFHARDDYFHVLAPAVAWLHDPGFDWDHSGMPGAGMRSHLLPRLVYGLLVALDRLGIQDPESALAGVQLVIGAWSVVAIPGMWLLASRLLPERQARLATWLAALHFAMPYAGTRLLIEGIAIPPLVFGLYFASHQDGRRLFAAGICVGLACWLRFQIGAAAIGIAIALGVRAWRNPDPLEAKDEPQWLAHAVALGRQLGPFAAGGALAVGLEGLFDLWTTERFLGPLFTNIAFNFDPPGDLPSSSPLTYVGTWLLLTIPPATLVLLPPLLKAALRLPLVTWPFVMFVGVHSLVGHKEERFMLPALPLFLLLFAAAPAELQRSKGVLWDRLRRLWPATRVFLVAILGVALFLAVSNQSQANLREAMVVLRTDGQVTGIVSLGPELQTYFLARPEVPSKRHGRFDALWLHRAMTELAEEGSPANRFLAFAADGPKVAIMLAAEGLECDPAEVIEGWWLDRVLYRLNPRHNQRRAPILLWRCERPSLASLSPL